jgi:hypothetical protein
MSSVFVCHNKCQIDVRTIILPNVIFIRYDFEYYSLKNLLGNYYRLITIPVLEKIFKSTTKLQINNFGLYVQTNHGDLTMNAIESTVCLSIIYFNLKFRQ